MREKNLPAGAAEIGAEVRARTNESPMNEPYLVDVTELLRAISVKELAERRRQSRRQEPT